ncbi:hypothetical protein EA462_10015 [Natrarchaeobius halalkaliphilus]|uniref:CHAT domain-containing protein n=1 Tax=Natrarchaeobius halalkaliphilus TaxID=1679091 RepID=A0A3N6LMH4_9EURY|nr:hypothetical protein [Natrarchaeobius halalkaliphilus]RQG90303.1 hypothetical protein EA462_10015 [Natrarchaeobius halalkaliphilus]
MIEWEVGAHALRVTDADNTELIVHGDDIGVEETSSDVPRPVDETVAVTARELRFPHAVVYAFSLDSNDQYELDPRRGSLSLPSGEFVIDIDTDIKTYLRISGPATINRSDGFESLVVTFSERTTVVAGFRSRHERPSGTITVPDSPEEVATAITHLSSSHKTTKPDRTYPTLRGHPPFLEAGDSLEIPPEIRNETPDTGIELLVPSEYETMFTVAPLAYYLQATIRTLEAEGVRRDPEHPRIRIPDIDVDERLSPMPTLECDVERVLRKTFFMDCLVRNAGPCGTNLASTNLLSALGLDPTRLYELSSERRLETYLDVPYAAIEHRLPDWHLSTYVTPSYDHVEMVPFLLDRLSMIYPPRTSELDGQELVERSLADFYRGGDRSSATVGGRASVGRVASVDIVKPELKNGRIHGWLADGVPIDVFKSAPEAYYNRLDYVDRASDTTSIRVILNDPEMSGEHDSVAEIYRRRSEELPIQVTVEDSLSVVELARLFEDDHDFVHYIGHCETDGLRCADGYLSTSSLDRSNVQTFFLNACGSFYEGTALIEKGSVAGAVTFTKVLNDHAVKVGSAFAKLLVHGFSIERAMRLARRRIMMGKDYAVVGDGTHSLTQGEHRLPTTVIVEPLDGRTADGPTGDDADEQFLVTFDCYSTRATGSYYFPHTAGNEYAYLCGTESNFTLSRSELAALLDETEASVIYDGDVYWSEELRPEFDS